MSLPVKKLENAIDYLVTEVYRESPSDRILDATEMLTVMKKKCWGVVASKQTTDYTNINR